MKAAIIYKSTLGTTRQYAQWLAEDVHADIYQFKEISPEILQGYDVIVIASGTYAGRMPLTKFAWKHWDILKSKKVILVAVGQAPPEDTASKQQYKLLPQEIRDHAHYFKIPGKIGKLGAELVVRQNLQPVLKYISG